MLTVGVVLAALGPFGSFATGDFAARLGYWLPAVLIGYALFRPLVAIGDWTAATLDLPRTATLTAAVLVAAIPGTIGIIWLNGALGVGLPAMDTLFPLYLNVALVGAIVTLVFVSLERPSPVPVGAGTSGEGRPEHSPVIASSLGDRLPPSWRGQVRALEMEDHYVRAHGPDGDSRLILMRMSDAVRALDGIDGLQVHRSWWVARSVIAGTRRDGRNLRLRLDDGREVPVARDRVAALRAAGWT